MIDSEIFHTTLNVFYKGMNFKLLQLNPYLVAFNKNIKILVLIYYERSFFLIENEKITPMNLFIIYEYH